jgi:hypothetical protein
LPTFCFWQPLPLANFPSTVFDIFIMKEILDGTLKFFFVPFAMATFCLKGANLGPSLSVD